MPIKQAAKKALRQSKKNKKVNSEWKEKIKTSIRKIRDLITEDKLDQAEKELPTLYKTLDKAAKSNIIKKNTARRKKSRLSSALNKAKKEQKRKKK